MRRTRLSVCVAVSLTGLLALTGTDPQGQVQPPIARTTTAGVLIDVTVVDRNGKPLLDLRPADFELAEDGAAQRILSVTLVQGGVVRAADAASEPASTAQPGPPPAPGAPSQAAPDSAVTPSVTAILFDPLSPEARPHARAAALAYISTLAPPHDYAGVFLSGATLTAFGSFTNQQESLRQAIDRLSATAPTQLSPNADRGSSPRIQTLPLDPSQSPTAGAESGSNWVNERERERLLNLGGAEGQLRRVELRMWEGYQQFLSEYAGQSSLAGLRAVVDAVAALPGRKSVLYFTENLMITSAVKPKFDALIGEANRGNITVYPVDATGLRVHSKELELNRNVGVAGGQGVGDSKREDGAWTRELERQEQLLTSRPTAALGRLAKETGGFVLENTNDLSAGVGRMQQERTTYYLLAYQPSNAVPDGRFRRVSVKVKRPRTTVKARPGYVALATQRP